MRHDINGSITDNKCSVDACLIYLMEQVGHARTPSCPRPKGKILFCASDGAIENVRVTIDGHGFLATGLFTVIFRSFPKDLMTKPDKVDFQNLADVLLRVTVFNKAACVFGHCAHVIHCPTEISCALCNLEISPSAFSREEVHTECNVVNAHQIGNVINLMENIFRSWGRAEAGRIEVNAKQTAGRSKRTKLVVIQICRDGLRSPVRDNNGALDMINNLVESIFRYVRQINQNTQPITFGDDFLAEETQVRVRHKRIGKRPGQLELAKAQAVK